QQPALGRWGPALAAGVGAAAFLGLAGILVHAAWSGDLLGFAPESVRTWIERELEVPPAAAGEGTRWRLDFQPYLRDAASDPWLAGLVALAAAIVVVSIYCREAPTVPLRDKLLLAGLRIFLILLALGVLLPQVQLRFDRQGWPDLVLLIDDSRSMGESDHFQDEKTREHARLLGEQIKKHLQARLPELVRALEAELTQKRADLDNNPALRHEVDILSARLKSWQNQLEQLGSPSWRPTRLQLAQALLTQTERDWLRTFLEKRRMKVHVYHLD